MQHFQSGFNILYGLCYVEIRNTKHHFQKKFSYIAAVSFIGGGNWSTWRKPQICCKSLTHHKFYNLLKIYYFISLQYFCVTFQTKNVSDQIKHLYKPDILIMSNAKLLVNFIITLEPAALGCIAVISPERPIPCPNLKQKYKFLNEI